MMASVLTYHLRLADGDKYRICPGNAHPTDYRLPKMRLTYGHATRSHYVLCDHDHYCDILIIGWYSK
ncbi:MAG: hypothetical protein F6K50_14845 [Moorea sp. SIO3I7]|uniref:hypothetical protein n=1 Tax=Moorena TaxID=1155738 RepID=UPI00117C1A8B|nr:MULTISPECIES: hypothetical protein [Moorena]NEN96760.1 hypothetical protein [Moorena sp. SIO3I7]NEO10381.1 hypothetical protein [Moorena sp. SIO3I8]